MNRWIRNLVRKWVPIIISYVEPAGKKGKWFERNYYTYLFTKSKHYSSAEPNPEELARWQHIRILVERVLLRKSVSRLGKIIDFGCGRGWLSSLLAGYGNVRGIEPIAKVVAYGRRLYPGVELVEGSVEMLTGQDADLIVCSEVLEHLGRNNVLEYMKSFYSGLTADGFLIITTPRGEAYDDWKKFVAPDQPVEEWLTEKEVLDFSSAAGFRTIEMIKYSDRPVEGVSAMEIYQQWLFQK